jgi:hypothetical protein
MAEDFIISNLRPLRDELLTREAIATNGEQPVNNRIPNTG